MKAPSGSARIAGVMGWPVGHSLSPRLHNYWIEALGVDGAYVPLSVRPKNVLDAIKILPKIGFAGINITLPHKEAVLDIVDFADDSARRIGAVNTIVIDEDGKSNGTNTDGFGFIENIRQQEPDYDFSACSALVIGTGGAARAIVVALQDAGATKIKITNRTPERAEVFASEIGGSIAIVSWDRRSEVLDDVSLLVNATSLGMVGHSPLELDLSRLPVTARVNDIVYTPLKTPLLADAQARGNRVVDGLGMLLHQARPGFESWFGVKPMVTKPLRDHILGT